MMIMEYLCPGIGKVKLTVGIKRRTKEKIQYCITAVEVWKKRSAAAERMSCLKMQGGLFTVWWSSRARTFAQLDFSNPNPDLYLTAKIHFFQHRSVSCSLIFLAYRTMLAQCVSAVRRGTTSDTCFFRINTNWSWAIRKRCVCNKCNKQWDRICYSKSCKTIIKPFTCWIIIKKATFRWPFLL